MEASVLPYVLYLFFTVIFILAFSVIGHIQRRVLMLFLITWLAASAAHYGMIVISAGQNPIIARDAVVWMIRLSVYVEALTFAASALAFVAENIDWKRANHE